MRRRLVTGFKLRCLAGREVVSGTAVVIQKQVETRRWIERVGRRSGCLRQQFGAQRGARGDAGASDKELQCVL